MTWHLHIQHIDAAEPARENVVCTSEPLIFMKRDCGHKEDGATTATASFNAHYPVTGYVVGIPSNVITHPGNNCVLITLTAM